MRRAQAPKLRTGSSRARGPIDSPKRLHGQVLRGRQVAPEDRKGEGPARPPRYQDGPSPGPAPAAPRSYPQRAHQGHRLATPLGPRFLVRGLEQKEGPHYQVEQGRRRGTSLLTQGLKPDKLLPPAAGVSPRRLFLWAERLSPSSRRIHTAVNQLASFFAKFRSGVSAASCELGARLTAGC